MSFTFTVRGTPRPKARARHIKGRVVTTASPKEKLWRRFVEQRAFAAAVGLGDPLPLFSGPVRVDMVFTFEPPASARDRLGRPHTQKPDKDNLEKLILDALVRSKVIVDDSKVAAGEPRKVWGERAGVTVVVAPISEQPAQAPTGAAEGDPPGWLTGTA